MADLMYHNFFYELMIAAIDLTTTTGTQLKMMLLDTNHSASTVDDAVKTDVNTNELANTGGYTTDGEDVTKGAMTPTDDDANDRAYFDINEDIVWATATFSAYYAVLYDDTHASDALICSYDFGGIKTASGGDFTLQFAAPGSGGAFYIA